MFHLVTTDAPYSQWDSINVLTTQAPGGFIASNSAAPVSGVTWNRWCRVIWANDWLPNNAAGLAAAIRDQLDNNKAARVMVDELRSGANDTRELVANTAALMPASYANRWGVFLVTGRGVSYDNLNATASVAMNQLFGAGAIVCPEFYIPHHTFVNSSGVTVPGYYESAGSSAARDTWAAKWFNGSTDPGFGQYKFPWLVAHRQAVWNSPYQRASQLSLLPIMLGVHSNYLNGNTSTSRAAFLDRLFYIWITQTGYPSSIYAQFGGPGSWHWRDSPSNIDGTF